MLSVIHHSNDPYFNIASEEYLLKRFTDDIFMLYCNAPSVIVGKHQNAFAEINLRYVNEHQIPVVRRLSGGGTVYHDSGNLNFAFIQNNPEGKQIDFKRFTQPVLEVLQNLGVPAMHSGRNDLLINGLKFSGNAEHVYKNRTLHHGTLLFNSALDGLRESLKVQKGAYRDRAVKSVRSQVTNISQFLINPLTIEEFTQTIGNHIKFTYPDVHPYRFTEYDLEQIEKLASQKYHTWDWNFGYSPRFLFVKDEVLDGCHYELELDAEKGRIVRIVFRENGRLFEHLHEELIGECFTEKVFSEKLSQYTSRYKTWCRIIF